MNNKNTIYKYRNDIIKSYEEYFRDGGLPETLMMSDKRSWISSLFNKIFFGDLVARHQVRNDFALRIMIRKLAESVKQPRMYGIPSVVDMSKFNITEPYQAPPSLHIGIEGYGRISKRAESEDVRAWRADEISKEELIAKYFSREIEAALTRRLSRLKGACLTAEVKKIENTMYFRLPSILRIPCSLNIPVGSTCDENPNVRRRSREELLRELVDQGYNINQYKL